MRAAIILPVVIAIISGITLVTFLGIAQISDLKSFEKVSFLKLNNAPAAEPVSNTISYDQVAINLASSRSFDLNSHHVVSSDLGNIVLEKQMSPVDYLAETYREQHFFCKLLPALRTAATQPLKKTIDLTPIKAKFDMMIYPKGDIVSDSIIAVGSWEAHLTIGIVERLQAVSLAINRTAVFLDIGANIAFHSLSVAAAGYPVVAFEPLPQNLLMMRWSLCENPSLKMEVYSKGLGEKKEQCRIVSHELNQSDGITICATSSAYPPLAPGYLVRADISVERLDDVMGTRFSADNLNGERIGVLKIDVEGFEIKAFKGGLKFLAAAKIPFIAAEIGMGGPAEAKEFITILDTLGYEIRIGDWNSGKALKPSDLDAYVQTVKLNDVTFVLREWIASHPESRQTVFWP